jgi:hypothetical protein
VKPRAFPAAIGLALYWQPRAHWWMYAQSIAQWPPCAAEALVA